jgi:hypothetical protein
MTKWNRWFANAAAGAAFSMCAGAWAQQPADCSTGPIPDRPLEITIGSEKLPTPPLIRMRRISTITSGDQAFDQYDVTVADKDMFGNIELSFSVIVPKGQQPDGRTFRKLPVHEISKQPGPPGMPEVQSWSVKDQARKLNVSHVSFVASLRVEFGKRSGGVLPGRVYLCAPGGQKAKIFNDVLADPITMVGRFEAGLPK